MYSPTLSRAQDAERHAFVKPLTLTPVNVISQLELRSASYVYPNLEDPAHPLRILNEASLKVSAGDIIALSGPSGSGKSTLLQLLASQLTPHTGELWWGRTRLDELDEGARARWRLEHVGLIFQDFRLFPHLTALENAALPLELLGESPSAAAERARSLLGELGLTRRLLHRPEALSGGERQRVAIARALAHRPMIILADEPTGNLDYESAQRAEDLLLSLPRRYGVGLLYVTHDLRFAARADAHFGVHEGVLLKREETR